MKPSPGRIVHFNVPHVGWRPMMVTSVKREVLEALAGLPSFKVCGWAKLGPDDCADVDKMLKLTSMFNRAIVANEVPVLHVSEGEDEGSWRWPPRID